MDNLRLAFWKARRGKQGREDAIAYERDLEANLLSLRRELVAEDVHVGDYRFFTIHDPKHRVICAASFRERVLHHAMMNVCHDVFDRVQIYDSYASRPGKGTVAAVDRAKGFAEAGDWFLKLDVRKYFDSISQDVLKAQLRRLFKDKPLLALLDRIIDSYAVSKGRGVPIGNLASQYFANHVLNAADHFIKQRLRVRRYIRYMDDMILWDSDQDRLRTLRWRVERFIADTLRLSLKPPCLNHNEAGAPFLGYVIFPDRLTLREISRKRFGRKLRKAYQHLRCGEWDEATFAAHVSPLVAFTDRADGAAGFRRKVMQCQGRLP